MSIYRRFAADHLPSFVTTNTTGRRPIFTVASTCELLVQIIYAARAEIGFQLLGFTIMPDHLHIILLPSATGRAQAVQLVKGRFARMYNQRAGRTGAVWQSRYHERTLRSDTALFRAIDYVHQNPVAARIVSEAGDYLWSSANGRYVTDLQAFLGQA